jgi:uncharacterized protein YjbJ (UPF0337 family)
MECLEICLALLIAFGSEFENLFTAIFVCSLSSINGDSGIMVVRTINLQEAIMVNKDTIAGKVKELGGAARANVAKATGDSESEAKGRTDQVAGKIQNTVGKIKDAI